MARLVRIELNRAGFARLAADVDRGTARAAGKVRDEAKRIIVQEGRVDTGAMLNSVHTRRVSSTPTASRHEVSANAEHSLLQHEGVQGPIYPKRARVLRFKPKGSAVFIFRPSVSGFSGIHYLTRALDRLTARDFDTR